MARRRVAMPVGGARYRAQSRIAVCGSAFVLDRDQSRRRLDDRLILKIFPPFLRSQFVSERISLACLRTTGVSI